MTEAALALLLVIRALATAGPVDLERLREDLRGAAIRQGCQHVTVLMRGRDRLVEVEVQCPTITPRLTPRPEEEPQ